MVSRVPRIWRRANVVLASSEAVASRLRGLNPRAVFAPVEPDSPDEAPPWRTGNGPVVGFVGRIEPRTARDHARRFQSMHTSAGSRT